MQEQLVSEIQLTPEEIRAIDEAQTEVVFAQGAAKGIFQAIIKLRKLEGTWQTAGMGKIIRVDLPSLPQPAEPRQANDPKVE